ncbi:DUF5130 family protein [Nocardioides insulae]|uniref:DUF5130 family protein n=1 Tax=Nocardioides insulae TaxID=394734 RepID=UPI0003F5AFBF|nr:DUF5130 family protein [Nocardioides insulae]
MPIADRRSGALTSPERFRLEEAVRKAELTSRVEFSVFLGAADGPPRAYAVRLHETLKTPSRTVLVFVDPVAGALEVVTGGDVRRTLTDQEVGLAVQEMLGSFAEQDLVGGLIRGIGLLAEHARS